MKKILFAVFVSNFLCQINYSQTTEITGKPIAEIFTDFHYNINDTSKTTGFGLNRAYLGYNFVPAGNFSGKIIVNIGNPDDLPQGALRRRYAYFREASLSWSKKNLNLSFGITGTRLFDYQQKFWGKRYLANTYQSLNGYGYVADLGVAIDYKFNEICKGDITIMNGEGYSDIQLDNGVRTSAGIIITPIKQLAIRLYGDIENPEGKLQYTLIGFFGFKNDLVMIGGEISYKSNLDMIAGHNAWGISATGGINILKNTELFARYDYSASVKVQGENFQWNFLNDGNFAIFGLQYTFSENVKMALNYQGIYPYDTDKKVSDAIFLNTSFRF
jgi:hypothetical protein